MKKKISVKNYLLSIAGLAALVLGTIGIFLPVLPTTPFLLIASYCFVRSSKKLHDWLMYKSIFSKYLQNYIKYHAVTLWTKIISISALWITITISFILIDNLYARIALAVVLLGVTIHLMMLKVMRK
ncbi:MAG: YbaN family protein [Candidatus Cloacimonetes bacterium]|nr:YbaN family protein [Candidatus Cloacimonadota bacterium]MCF7869192.1 YbaN family protein [Candidatus Cloacimonadota bacterium]